MNEPKVEDMKAQYELRQGIHLNPVAKVARTSRIAHETKSRFKGFVSAVVTALLKGTKAHDLDEAKWRRLEYRDGQYEESSPRQIDLNRFF